MIQNVTIPPGTIPTEVTQYAKQYANGVAIINTGNGDLYLGDDTNVTVFNGVLVTPTNSVVWTESPKVFAVSPTGTTVQVASNVSFNAPAAVAVTGPVEIAGDLNLAAGTVVDIGTIPAIDLAAGSSVIVESGSVNIAGTPTVQVQPLVNKWTWTNMPATGAQNGISDGVVIPASAQSAYLNLTIAGGSSNTYQVNIVTSGSSMQLGQVTSPRTVQFTGILVPATAYQINLAFLSGPPGTQPVNATAYLGVSG